MRRSALTDCRSTSTPARRSPPRWTSWGSWPSGTRSRPDRPGGFGRRRARGACATVSAGSGHQRARAALAPAGCSACRASTRKARQERYARTSMIEDLVAQIEMRFAELGEQITDPEVISDRARYAEVGRAYRQLEPAAKLAAAWRHAQDDAAGAEELIEELGEDVGMREELEQARERIERLAGEVRLAMVEQDPNDEKGVIVEIQGGAGGEEAGLWAGDVYRMLSRYAERRGWPVEPIEVREGKDTFPIHGRRAQPVFKFEGGTHRVQRVPATESQGRIHTSTATVAVLPEAEDVDVHVY